eukprot:12241075-Alexandrium_andersonii.AAC.1
MPTSSTKRVSSGSGSLRCMSSGSASVAIRRLPPTTIELPPARPSVKLEGFLRASRSLPSPTREKRTCR